MDPRNDLLSDNQQMVPFAVTLERFLASEDFYRGVVASTRASWGGSGYSVELFPDGLWRLLWNGQIGNRYDSPGRILRLPTVDTSELSLYVEEGHGTEEEFLQDAFFCEEEELKQDLREQVTFIYEEHKDALHAAI